AGFGYRTDTGDWPPQSARGHETEHPGAVLLGGPVADRRKRDHWDCGVRRIYVAAATGTDGQDAGLGSAAAGALVGRSGPGIAGAERRGRRALSSQQGGEVGSGGGVAAGVTRQLPATSFQLSAFSF